MDEKFTSPCKHINLILKTLYRISSIPYSEKGLILKMQYYISSETGQIKIF